MQSIMKSSSSLLLLSSSFQRRMMISSSTKIISCNSSTSINRRCVSSFMTCNNIGGDHSNNKTNTTSTMYSSTASYTSPLDIVSRFAPYTTSITKRCMNSDTSSHDDFGPVKKAVVSDNMKDVHAMIEDHIKNNKVMVYMKGNPKQPMCGFSAKVVNILQEYNINFSSVNVLDYPVLRDGIKTFSNWPTIPQIYINHEFIGGCDIIISMHESGELKDLLLPIQKEQEQEQQEK